MTENRDINDNIGKLYRQIGNADDKYVDEMLDDALAKKIRMSAVKRRSLRTLAFAAVIALVCAAAYPVMNVSLKKDSEENTAVRDTSVISEEETKDVNKNFAAAIPETQQAEGDMQAADEEAEAAEDNNAAEAAPHTNTDKAMVSEDALQKPWEERETEERYTDISGFRGVDYFVCGEISAEEVGGYISDFTAWGLDEKSERHEISCSLYEINGELPEKAVAVSFDGGDKYYRFEADA